MSSKTGDELRDLSLKIKELLHQHHAFAPAGAVVHNCCDHLEAIARNHDVNVSHETKHGLK